jgi:putative FmdB family regulatory protein
MPIYEYKCPSCGKVFEEWTTSHETTPQPCPECGAQAPHIVSNTTFVLKGGGWYVTEYGNRKREQTTEPARTSDATAPVAPGAATAADAAGAANAADTSGSAAKSETAVAPASKPAGPETASAA